MRFKDKKVIEAIEKIYVGDPVLYFQGMFAHTGQQNLIKRNYKVWEEMQNLIENSEDIVEDIAFLAIWTMDVGLVFDESLYDEILKRFDYETQFKEKITDFEKENKYYLHGRVSQVMIKEMFIAHDPHLLNAVAYHETLKPDVMHSELEKVLFVADKLVPKFDNPSHVEIVRKALGESVNTAIRAYLNWYMENAPALGEKVHPYMPQVFKDYNKVFTNTVSRV